MLNQLLDDIKIAWPVALSCAVTLTKYVCPNCGDVVVFKSDEPPPEFHAFCFECGKWVDFEKEQ